MSVTTEQQAAPTKGVFEGAELRLLKSGRLSDCQVSIGSRTWKLHKFIICDRSKYFDRALCGDFAEAACNTVVISESDMSDYYFDWIVRWLYGGGKQLYIQNKPKALPSIIEVFIYADYLDIRSLCEESSEAIVHYTTELHAEPPTTKAHKDMPSDWVEAMRIFYETFRGEEKHGLKSALFDMGLQNRKFRKRVFELPKLEELIIDIPGFCQDLMLETVRRKL